MSLLQRLSSSLAQSLRLSSRHFAAQQQAAAFHLSASLDARRRQDDGGSDSEDSDNEEGNPKPQQQVDIEEVSDDLLPRFDASYARNPGTLPPPPPLLATAGLVLFLLPLSFPKCGSNGQVTKSCCRHPAGCACCAHIVRPCPGPHVPPLHSRCTCPGIRCLRLYACTQVSACTLTTAAPLAVACCDSSACVCAGVHAPCRPRRRLQASAVPLRMSLACGAPHLQAPCSCARADPCALPAPLQMAACRQRPSASWFWTPPTPASMCTRSSHPRWQRRLRQHQRGRARWPRAWRSWAQQQTSWTTASVSVCPRLCTRCLAFACT